MNALFSIKLGTMINRYATHLLTRSLLRSRSEIKVKL
jgi:hypothetical protein